jgi:hypothetical protein
VLSITTNKVFEIDLANGARFFGSVRAAQDSGAAVIQGGTLAVEVEMVAIVMMTRIKPDFWSALDGSIDLGFSFAQQSSKTDVNLGASLSYKKDLNNHTFKRKFLIKNAMLP